MIVWYSLSLLTAGWALGVWTTRHQPPRPPDLGEEILRRATRAHWLN